MLVAACLAQVAAPAYTIADDEPPGSASQPNIVIFYLDDTSPHDGRLWNDPQITPSIYEHFVANGVHLSNAIGETPLCCPARGALLTGLHTHNHGVKTNDAMLLDPSYVLPGLLQGVGYDTMIIGKYLNKTHLLTTAEWAAHSAPWTHMDVFRNNALKFDEQYFMNWSLFTKEGLLPKNTDTHSTQMVAERAVMRMRETPPDRPIFALLSIYNTHTPNMPMPGFDFSKCDAMPPWLPGNYDEKNVTDKPSFVKAMPRLKGVGWPMVAYCQEMLGVDWLVEQVTAELAAQGRLENTLLVFTADNGMTWGAHRIPQEKQWPYSTPVPLYFSWPARWAPRTVAEHTSDIDLAPTFCDLAGCTLDAYPHGQTQPDGISLVQLLDGHVADLGRDVLLESNHQKYQWAAVRTTPLYADGLWHYIEWDNGERELYDLAADPWELVNVATKAAYAEIRAGLADRLAALRWEGRGGLPAMVARPDGLIAVTPRGPWKKDDLYAQAPVKKQTQTITGALAESVHEFFILIQNDGDRTDTLLVGAYEGGTKHMKISYFDGGIDVTAAVRLGSHAVVLEPGAASPLIARFTVGLTAPLGSQRKSIITVSSQSNSAQVDVVRAITAR